MTENNPRCQFLRQHMLKIAAAGFGALLVYAVFVTVQAWYYQAHVGRTLEVELGFTGHAPVLQFAEKRREVFTIRSVQPGGVFERAGFENGDIILGRSMTGFYRMLHQGRGEVMTVSVAEGGNGPILSERRMRELRFKMPST